MGIIIMIDSGASLPSSILKRKDIHVVPLRAELKENKVVELNENNHEINSDSIFIVRKPHIADIKNIVDKYIEEGLDVLYITLSSKLSNEYEDLAKAFKDYDHNQISIVDSLNVGTGQALLALKAIELVDKGYGLKYISNNINELKHTIKSTYIIENFPFMYSQNICKDFESKYINFKDRYPILNLYEGDARVCYNSAKLDVAYQILEDNIFDNINLNCENEILITYVSNKEEAEKIKKSLKRRAHNINVTLIKSNSFLKLCLGEKGMCYSIIKK